MLSTLILPTAEEDLYLTEVAMSDNAIPLLTDEESEAVKPKFKRWLPQAVVTKERITIRLSLL